MKKKLTRRKFLETSLTGSLLIGGRSGTSLSLPVGRASQIRTSSTPAFDPHQREVLRAAIDEIIPASDGMPAASEVGGVEYLNRLAGQNPELKGEFQNGLARLEELSRKRFRRTFLQLSREERVRSLHELEKQPAPNFFFTLRDLVYEAYYTNPQVWKLIGYEFHATNDSGPKMKPFDEALLAGVRKRPRFYREVP